MPVALFPADPEEFAKLHFGGARLSDPRRRRRVIKVAAAYAAHPGRSIPQLFPERSYERNAAYDLFKNPDATPDHLQAGHRELTREAIGRADSPVLLIEDTTTLSWSGNAPVAGLGPISNSQSGLQGFDAHSVLAARWTDESADQERRPPLELLGLADQQYFVRIARHGRKVRGGEMGRLWRKAGERIGSAPAAARWIRIADRGADILDFLASCRTLGHGFIVRAAQDRVVVGASQRLFSMARDLPELGRMELSLRGRDGHPARSVILGFSACRVDLRAPIQKGRKREGPLTCWALRVFEIAPADPKQALEWILLSDEPVQSAEQARSVARRYACRWLIEEFHKALKSGFKAEKLQLESAERLFAAVAIMSVTALRLIELRELARREPECPAQHAGLSEIHLKVLAHKSGRILTTVRDVVLALGRMGGYAGPARHPRPGWLTLWRGWHDLDMIVQGVLLAKKLRRSQE